MDNALRAVIAAVAAPAAGVAGWVTFDSVTAGSATPVAATASAAHISFVDVGQGDSVVMRIGDTVVLSDAGELFPERVDAALRSLGAERIDIAVLSHPHDDHAANLIPLIREHKWKIGRAIMSESAHWRGTKTNRKIMSLLEQKQIPIRFVSRGESFGWGGARWTILNPPFGEFTGGSAQAANVSIAYLLRVNGAQVLFTGDVEEHVSLNIASDLMTRLDGRVDVFLATHHGSRFGSIEELLDAAQPRWSVLSVGEGNQFGHPAQEAIDRLKAARSSIWCTDTNGTITARISASGRITWKTSDQAKPWWSSADRRRRGTCAGR